MSPIQSVEELRERTRPKPGKVKPLHAGFSEEQVPVPDSASFLLGDSGKPPGLCPLLPSCSVISGKMWVEKRKGLLKATPHKKPWQCASPWPWQDPMWIGCESLAESHFIPSLSFSQREADR